ncbi:LacI family DNA-binding transcriptional regulator [Paenibacillus marinisediminis]
MKPKVTMQDIADHLGISKNSVSQALSGKDGVSEETRRLIYEAAEQMGYTYSKGRRKRIIESEPSRGTGNIALIASDFAFSQKSFFGEIYLAIEREASNRGSKLLIQSITQEMMQNRIMPSFIADHQVDGILILSHIDTSYTNEVIATGIPTVLIDHHHPDVHADCLLINNRFSAYEAISHLVQLGHKQIGFVGNIQFSPSYYERLDGFRLAMYNYGLTVREEWILKHAEENQVTILSAMQALKEQPTAWFCVNDGLGFLVNSTLQQLGYRIPADISICSFDNGQLSQLAVPSTTTMDVDLTLYGRKAVEQLFWRMKHREEPFMEILLPTKLIKRESTAVCTTS